MRDFFWGRDMKIIPTHHDASRPDIDNKRIGVYNLDRSMAGHDSEPIIIYHGLECLAAEYHFHSSADETIPCFIVLVRKIGCAMFRQFFLKPLVEPLAALHKIWSVAHPVLKTEAHDIGRDDLSVHRPALFAPELKLPADDLGQRLGGRIAFGAARANLSCIGAGEHPMQRLPSDLQRKLPPTLGGERTVRFPQAGEQTMVDLAAVLA